jgi:predicted MFS family arabinose efflux permease
MGFLFLLIEVEMDATKTAMGVTILVSCISEVLTFPFTHRLIKWVGGPIRALEVGLLMYVVRFVALSYIKNAWFTIPIHLLHSVTFALFWAASIEQTEAISTEHIYGTMFGLLNSVYFGCGGLTGNMGGGLIFDAYSGLSLYRYSAILSAVLLVLFVVYFHVEKLCKSKAKSPGFVLT